MKHIHILGICGTFMGSLAILAKEKGFNVSGSDANIYSPMDQLLNEHQISIFQNYNTAHLQPKPDLVVVGNCMKRGDAVIEFLLNSNIPYISGPAFISQFILKDKWVVAASGTHGKTSTASMLAWILEYAEMQPGFLIGGIPLNFGTSSRLGQKPFFVIEADEYDTAFFDKRSKFIHYKPKTLLINNLEFDHADIFDDIECIQRQFHHFIRTISSESLIIIPSQNDTIEEVLNQGCWTPVCRFGDDQMWSSHKKSIDGKTFNVIFKNEIKGTVDWKHTGSHNVKNAMGAILAAKHLGVSVQTSCRALYHFKGIKRRMEFLAEIQGIRIFDDFAHHPTAIQKTLEGWRACVDNHKRIRVVIEPRSNTMKQGVHKNSLAESTQDADEVIWFCPSGVKWSLEELCSRSKTPSQVFYETASILNYLIETSQPDDDIIIMSNGSFNSLHTDLTNGLKKRQVAV